jgi:urease accessory protein UreF
MDQDGLLRLLAEAYGQMMLARSGRRGEVLSEEELGGWLRQLRELALSGDGDTVLALFSALRAQHSWARLRDVYSALVQLRGSHSLGETKRKLGG